MEMTHFVLLLLAVVLSTFASVYYVVPEDGQSCPQMGNKCHNLSYYISHVKDYFTSNSTIVFLEGEHKLEREDHVLVHGIDSLGLRLIGQGQWVEGSEKTVWQSTVIINCTKGRGGFSFRDSNNIAIEMLTMINCGSFDPTHQYSVFSAVNIWNISIQFIAIQYNTGVGINVENCINVEFKKNSFYRSNEDPNAKDMDNCKLHTGGGIHVGISSSHTVSDNFKVLLSDSNFTKGCSNLLTYEPHGFQGGSISLLIECSGTHTNHIRIHLNNLVLTQNRGINDGGFEAVICAYNSKILLAITNCTFLQGKGGSTSVISIQNVHSTFSPTVLIKNTQFLENACSMEHSYIYSSIVDIARVRRTSIQNCTFTRNSGCSSVIRVGDFGSDLEEVLLLEDSTISDNNMTGLVAFDQFVIFKGKNEIRNNRDQQGAGITVTTNTAIFIAGSLFFHNNIASLKGGAILVVSRQYIFSAIRLLNICSLGFSRSTTAVYFSGNRAGQGGSDIYGGILTDCSYVFGFEIFLGPDGELLDFRPEHYRHALNVGTPNETSWYFDTPFMRYFNFSDADRLSSISTDPVMVCFCTINGSLLPDCSDRTRHMETYPGVQLNVTVATVGKYGGTSPGTVQLDVENAKLVQYFVHQQETLQCSPIEFLLQSSNNNLYPSSAQVDISVKGGAPGSVECCHYGGHLGMSSWLHLWARMVSVCATLGRKPSQM